MWVWDSRNRVPWGHHQRRKHLHEPGQNPRHSRMANTNEEKTVAIVPRLHQLLLMFHQRIQQSHQTHDAVDRKWPMEMGDSTTRHILGTKEAVGGRSGTGNTNRGRQIPCWGRCQQRSNRCSIVTGTEWKMAPSHLSIQVPHSYWTKLRNLQQRTTHNHAHPWRVETLANGSSSGLRNLDRSSKSPVLLKTPEAESSTSTLGNRTGRIPLLPSP